MLLMKGVFDMPDMFNMTPQMQEYFNALPEMIQETIIQSGAKVNSLEDLKAIAEGNVKNEYE